MSTIDLTEFLSGGMGLWWGQGAGEPVSLVDAALEAAADAPARSIRAFSGLTFNPRFRQDVPEGLALLSYGALGELRKVAAGGRLEIIPANYSALPRLFARGLLPADVGLVQVSPPGPDGRVSLGVAVDYAGDFLTGTKHLIAEINHAMPTTRDAPTLPLSAFAATLEVDRPLAVMATRAPDDIDRAIAGHVAELIHDGATLQVGVGSLPSAILQALSGHRELGFHSGMITDGVLDLIKAGVATGARKEIDTGLAVTGSAMGSAALYAQLDAETPVSFRPTSYTHHPAVLSRLSGLVSINSALEVDLAGQIGSERAGGRDLGAIGGQADFSRAAAHTGARSIIALRSTSKGHSTIRSVLDGGRVTTARADVDVVVTEHGAAVLTGRAESDRARALIGIAAEEHREDLAREARDRGILTARPSVTVRHENTTEPNPAENSQEVPA